ncbi:MAG: lipoyl(octanoyl) transferase LipB [Solirubrobacteraceae bacterium]
MQELWVCWIGEVPYREALPLQERLRDARQADAIADVLLLLEHPPVYTRGRRSTEAELPYGEAWYSQRGIEIVDVDRGGKVTYHGPGQLVGYPIMRVGSIIGFLRTIEGAIVAALSDEGLEASGGDDRPTGVWVGERKIASIGIHVARHVTTHGFAVNVDNDLTPFDWIVPCGLEGVEITSVSRETGRSECLNGFRERMALEFARACGMRRRVVTPAQLQAALGALVGG